MDHQVAVVGDELERHRASGGTSNRKLPAGILGSPRHDHTQSRGDLVSAFGDILANDVQHAAAAWTGLGLWLDHHFLTG
jgi:hypothetical protein